jgi:hypothetical protein
MSVPDFIALRSINAPNSYARAYNPGDGVTVQVVEDWGLVLGEDVEATADYQPPRPADSVQDRAAWEAYVVGQGTDLGEARASSLDDLKGMYDPPPPPEPPAHDLPANASAEGVDGTGVQNPTPVDVPSPVADPAPQPTPDDIERPSHSARKQEWIDYVVAAGGDPEWANADDTTKDDLVAWTPGG